MFGICNLAIVPVRAEASDRSEQVSQLLFGEYFKIIEMNNLNLIIGIASLILGIIIFLFACLGWTVLVAIISAAMLTYGVFVIVKWFRSSK